ncbi:PREDICTED: uncharacterized SDCCAG3 family protein-like [Ceratosolen solmsi marchali]|uniref:Uncharacterized SDCCAG3 family protein-like n=1 Tax=Ceratosolen solmsi marchali TaxID=326594 RepID=A0AAJ7DVL1_9HYME|nr:PREDICTED: uncharacterized SDCCAG3 family protein-like [Ceratosolen solmsi marchali]
MTNIKKLKSQQKLIKKEISTMNRSIPRIKDTEINELELILSHHDKDLYTRWIKSKWKFEAIEELMFNIQKKQLAMDTLNTLISRYLDKIKKNDVLTNDLPEENSINKNKSDSLLSSISSSPSKIPPPPPILPIPLTVTTLNRNNSKHSWVQRRFRAERRGNFGSVRPITEYQETEPYVFSLNLNNTRNNTSSNTSILKSQSSRLSTSSSNHILNSSSNNQIGTSENSTRQFKNDLELKPEIQSVFQALLGQRTIPLMITNG